MLSYSSIAVELLSVYAVSQVVMGIYHCNLQILSEQKKLNLLGAKSFKSYS